VRHVEQHDRVKKALRQAAFVWSTLVEWSGGEGREEPSVSLHRADGSNSGPYQMAVVANADPYTYLGSQAMHVHPQASFDEGLDLVTVAKVGTPALLGILARVFRGGSHVRSRHVAYHHDLDAFTLTAPRPLPLMVDGDYAGEHTWVTFTAVREALCVLA
jgi:diacylglycerol kinase family enzyme